MRGKKTGGRLPGTPNKKSLEIRDLVAEKYPGYHPVLALAEIATDPANEVSIRLQANKEVAKYVAPQLKAVEIKHKEDEEVRIIVVRTSDEETKQALEHL